MAGKRPGRQAAVFVHRVIFIDVMAIPHCGVPSAAVEVYNFSSLGCCRFLLRQLLCTLPSKVIVGGGSPRLCRPATLPHVFALFRVRRDLFYDCQVRLRIAVLQEFLHADRREGCQDGGIGPLNRKSVGCAASHRAAPRKSDDYRRDRADCYPL